MKPASTPSNECPASSEEATGEPSETLFKPDPHSTNSSTREKILEHLFVGELLRCLWCAGVQDVEVLRAEVDAGGFDVVIECNGILRHIQLKASHRLSSTAKVDINLRLARKPSGCVIWLRFDEITLELGPFLWFGNAPGAPLPDLGDRIARHARSNRKGVKSERPAIRTVKRTAFRSLGSMGAVVHELFGEMLPAVSEAPACG